ncbi:MAG TPA: MFS transporter [Mycobacteriales bacterium]|jgi:EmrB/QacA subfamily drug resistance transporter|nr:MFS transporter [Mycobacteriales bacterium]
MTTPVTRRAALVVICGVLALTFLDTTVVSVALGSIQTHLHLGVTGLQWVVDAYAVAFASLMLTGGTLGDRFGRRRLMLAGVAVFAAASLMGALANSGNLLIASRALMGVGAAASEPGTLSVLRQVYPDRHGRARALGLWAAVSCLGLALGPIVGGLVVGIWDWRGVFWLNVVVAMILLVAGHRYVPESSDPHAAPVDLPGQLLAIGGIATIVVGLIEGERAGYAAGHIITLFVLGTICIAGFVWRELVAAAPMLDLRYFRHRRFNAALAVAFAAYFGTFSIFFFSALYLEAVDGFSGYRTALLFLPMTVMMVGGAVAGGRLVVRRGGRWTMSAGAMLAAAGIAASEPLLHADPPFVALMATLAMTGLGMGTAMVPVTSVVLEVVPPEHSGMAASATNTARQLGVVFGVAILGSLVNARLKADLAEELRKLHVPSIFHDPIIRAYENGQLQSSSGSGGGGLFNWFVDQIRASAFVAFHDGLTSALTISAILIAAAALFAGYAAARGASE